MAHLLRYIPVDEIRSRCIGVDTVQFSASGRIDLRVFVRHGKCQPGEWVFVGLSSMEDAERLKSIFIKPKTRR